MKKILVLLLFLATAVYARTPFSGEGATGTTSAVSALSTQSNGTTLSNSVSILNFGTDFALTDSPAGKTNVSIDDTTFATIYLTTATAASTYSPLNQAQDYAVCISSPLSLGSVATLISPFRNYAVTISTISAAIIGGTNVAFMVEQRTIAGIGSAGTDIWTGDITATTSWVGGTAADFTVPAGSALFLMPTSVSGSVDRLMIKYRVTRD